MGHSLTSFLSSTILNLIILNTIWSGRPPLRVVFRYYDSSLVLFPLESNMFSFKTSSLFCSERPSRWFVVRSYETSPFFTLILFILFFTIYPMTWTMSLTVTPWLVVEVEDYNSRTFLLLFIIFSNTWKWFTSKSKDSSSQMSNRKDSWPTLLSFITNSKTHHTEQKGPKY